MLHHHLNHKDRFFSVYIDVNESLQISSFEPEDLFILLITKLVEALKDNGLDFSMSGLKELADAWIAQDPEIVQEVEKKDGAEAGAQMEAGVKFWNFLSVKGNLKTAFSYNSKTSKSSEVTLNRIRETILPLLMRSCTR